MCGIAGFVSPRPLAGTDACDRIARMTRTLRHRGPDAERTLVEGHVALGHTRLSIIDLSSAGCQPMEDDTGRYVLAYNGEVYNYLELRRELEGKGCRFRTATDSEVVLVALREWGPNALERFNGMWALALWDRARQALFLARDRAGKKPLYYATAADGELYFASELRALREVGLRFRAEGQALFDFLTQGTYGHLPSGTFFHGVRQLPAAHAMTVTPDGEATVARYWEPPVVAPSDRLPYDDAFKARFRELLTDAVRLRLRSDVPVGATLSGGLDSSTLVLLVDRLTGGAPLHLFTSLFPGSRHDETPYYEAVRDRLTSPIEHRVDVESEHWTDVLTDVLDHQEEPFGDTSIFAHYHLMRAARGAGVPVVISGQGGDELLLGYPSMVSAYLGHLLARGKLSRAAHEVHAWAASAGMAPTRVLLAAMPHALPLPVRDRLRARYVASHATLASATLRSTAMHRRFTRDVRRAGFDDYVTQVFTRFAIPHLTHYDDRNAMAFSVESRMPFLDYRLVELMFSASSDAVFADGITKRVLRESMRDVLPEPVRARRDKVGFHTPLARWLREANAAVRAYMTRDRIESLGAIDATTFGRRNDRLLAGDDAAALDVWRSYIVHRWAERFDVQGIAWA